MVEEFENLYLSINPAETWRTCNGLVGFLLRLIPPSGGKVKGGGNAALIWLYRDLPKDTFTEETTVTASRDTAWRALDQPSTWEGIAGVDRVHDPVFDADNRLRGFSFETRIGGSPYPGKASPRERVEGKIMAWDISSAHIKGWISVEFSDDGDQTVVRVTIEVESIGFLASMMFPTITGAIKRGMAETVESFAASLTP